MKESRRNFLKQGSKALVGASMLGSLDACSPENFQEHYEYTFESPNGTEAHTSGNEFSKKVGEILKQQYPARIQNPSVKIEVTEQGFKFSWNCSFVKANNEDADYYFDRRGTLKPGDTPQMAHNEVEAELKQSGKVQEMMDTFDSKYGNHRMPDSFVSESISQPVRGVVWCVREFFCTAKK